MARSAFTDSFLPTLWSCAGVLQVLLGHWGALIRIGCVPDCCQWPSWSLLWFVYIPVAYWEHSTTVSGLIKGRAHLQLAHPAPPPAPSHPPTTVAISLLYLYNKSCMAIMQHRRTTAASEFQNSISRNTKCDNVVSFSKFSHIIYITEYCNILQYSTIGLNTQSKYASTILINRPRF